MTSKLVVNNIESDTGINTVTFSGEISATKINSSSTSEFSSGLNVTGGNVGIGTDNPDEKLEVFGDIKLSQTSTRLIFEDSNSSNLSINRINSYDGAMIIDVDSNNDGDVASTFRVSIDGSERLRIKNNGNLGIGTDNPATPLHLFGTSDILLKVESTDQYAHIELGDNSSTARITNDGATGTLRLRADKDNAVSSSNIQFEIDGSEKVRIDSNGRVGIGTDNPRTKLDVDGGLIVKVSGTQPAWVSNAITGQEKFSIWQGASFDNACFSLDVDNGQSFLNHNVYYYSGWKQRLGGHTPIMIQLSSSNGVVFQKSSDNGAGTNDTATTLTELCRINTSGNLVFPSGQGIDFSATTDATGMDSELLDDYEEGTFTMTMSCDGNTASQECRYTKIGRIVYIDGHGDQETSNFFNTGANGTGTAVTITTNLPFTPVRTGAAPITVSRTLVGANGFEYERMFVGWRKDSATIYLGSESNQYAPTDNVVTDSSNQTNKTILFSGHFVTEV